MTENNSRMKRALRLLSRSSMFALGLVMSGVVAAECSSDFYGLATINEVFELGQGKGNPPFIEVKVLTSEITRDDYEGWTLQACVSGGDCSGVFSLSTANDSTYPWIIINEASNSNFDVNDIDLQGMDILLKDGSGDTIDYLSVSGFDKQKKESDCDPAYAWQFTSPGKQTKNIKRRPDGTGPWETASGNSDKPSKGTTNDGDPDGPAVSINGVAVFPGDEAEFSVTLDAVAGSNLSVNFVTRDNTAEQGKDYEYRSGTVTIEEGATEATIAVPTFVTDSREGKRFFVDLSNPSAGQVANQIGIGYILPEPNGYWRLESRGWSGTKDEVLDYSGNKLNGRARNGTQARSELPALTDNPGTCGYADLNGAGQYLEIPDDGDLDLKEQLTVSAWFYARELPSAGGLKAIVSKSGNYAFFLTASGEITWRWETKDEDPRSLTTSGANITPKTWHHVAITYAEGGQLIYVDGRARASAAEANELADNKDSLLIGWDRDKSDSYFNGFVDEVRVYETALPANAIEALRARRHVCVQNLSGLDLPTPETASVCKPLALTLSARDRDGGLLTDYDGTVMLSTSAGHGNWSVIEGAGVLTPNVDDDDNGEASYHFSASDGGDVRLSLFNTHPDRLTITAGDPDADVVFTTPVIEFLSSSLLIEPMAGLGDDIIAGRRHGFSVSLMRQDPDDGSCGVDEGYDGLFSLKAWLTRSANDPGGQEPDLIADSTLNGVPDSAPGKSNVDLRFNEGVATVDLNTFDVGAYTLNLLDEESGHAVDETGEPIAIGSSLSTPPWVVRPFAFSVVATNADGGGVNPGATNATGPAFVTAGSAFDLTVTARLYQSADDADGDGIADDGASLTNNPVAEAFGRSGTEVSLTSDLRLPAGGVHPGLSGNPPILSDFVDGEAANDFVFNEVGIIDVTASVQGNDYLGMGATRTARIRGASGPVGRFYPADFLVTVSDAGTLEASCTAGFNPFTYIGETINYGITPEYLIEPVTESGDLTRNYAGAFRHLESSEVSLDYPVADSGNGLTVAVNEDVTALSENGDGTLQLTFGADQFTYVKNAAARVAPFTASLALSVNGILETLDGVSSSSVPVIATPTGVLLKYGRLHLDNSFGPETESLVVPMQLEFFNGSGFVLNSDDSCWSYNTGTEATVNPIGFTSVEGEVGTFSAGVPPSTRLLRLSAPGEGNTGEVTVTYAAPDWLRDDNDGDGSLDAPSALATFGVYRGHDRVIYWQER